MTTDLKRNWQRNSRRRYTLKRAATWYVNGTKWYSFYEVIHCAPAAPILATMPVSYAWLELDWNVQNGTLCQRPQHTPCIRGFETLVCLCSSKGRNFLHQINDDANLRQAGREGMNDKFGSMSISCHSPTKPILIPHQPRPCCCSGKHSVSNPVIHPLRRRRRTTVRRINSIQKHFIRIRETRYW